MAGGAGTRFWPASTEERPKQFLDILGTGKSLLRMTYERFLPLTGPDRILVATHRQYVDLVLEQLPELKPDQILPEPSRNNTAPCIAYAAMKLYAKDPEACLVVAPSDHLILKEAVYLDTLRKALSHAVGNDAICTLGIRPSRPDTGYGYIDFDPQGDNDIHPVRSFREKPDLDTATGYLAQGHYLWNAGIFIFSATTILRALEAHAPRIPECLASVPWNSPDEYAVLQQRYPGTPDISIDYAVMERAGNVYTIPADIGWSDLGTWASLYAELPKDPNGNAVQSGRSILQDAGNNLIRTRPGKTVVVRGLSGMIVVDEPDALLIYPMASEQEIKQVSQQIRAGH